MPMLVVAIKLTDIPDTTKVVYEKDGAMYIRTGADGFQEGKKAQTSLMAILTKWGFTRVQNPPQFDHADDIIENLDRFQVKSDGSIVFSH